MNLIQKLLAGAFCLSLGACATGGQPPGDTAMEIARCDTIHDRASRQRGKRNLLGPQSARADRHRSECLRNLSPDPANPNAPAALSWPPQKDY